MRNDVVVVMSTYNGEKYVERQLDSIFCQKDVDITVVVRDDHSIDNTVSTIKHYKERTGNKIILIEGENEGYAKSFWDTLCMAPESSYYAFSDQDDVWKEDKLIKSISALNNNELLPQLAYCRMTRTDPTFVELVEQVRVLKPSELNKKLVLTQTFNYGAATVINNSARKLICRWFPSSPLVPHDTWIGLLCYWFGKVHYIDESLYYWIRYQNSVTGEGTKHSGMKYRIKETLKGNSYMNVASDIINNYEDVLSEEDREFLNKLMNYKTNFRSKIQLLCDKDFKRSSFMGSLILKLGILTNKF